MKRNHLLVVTIVGLAIYLTSASQHYAGPPTCPTNGCSAAVLRSGFPLPVFTDIKGSSPTSGIGVLGPEDFAFEMFVLNVVLYSLMLWVLWNAVSYAIARLQRQKTYRPY